MVEALSFKFATTSMCPWACILCSKVPEYDSCMKSVVQLQLLIIAGHIKQTEKTMPVCLLGNILVPIWF